MNILQYSLFLSHTNHIQMHELDKCCDGSSTNKRVCLLESVYVLMIQHTSIMFVDLFGEKYLPDT